MPRMTKRCRPSSVSSRLERWGAPRSVDGRTSTRYETKLTGYDLRQMDYPNDKDVLETFECFQPTSNS